MILMTHTNRPFAKYTAYIVGLWKEFQFVIVTFFKNNTNVSVFSPHPSLYQLFCKLL